MKRIVAVILAASLGCTSAFGQSAPSWISYGYTPTAGQLRAAFTSKQDLLTFSPLNVAGGTMTGKLQTAPATINGAGFRLLPGIAPTAPANGDLWVTGNNIYAQVNGTTVTLGPVPSATYSGNVTVGSLTITGSGSTGDVSGMSVTASGATRTLATWFPLLAPLASPTFTGTLTAPTIAITGSGSTGDVSGTSVTLTDGTATARTLAAHLRDNLIYPQDYGAKCDGVTNDQVAFQAALNVATSTGRGVHIGGATVGGGPGFCLIGSTLTINQNVSLIGDGPSRSYLVSTFNGPIFTWNTNGPGGATDATEVGGNLVTGFTLRGQFAAGATTTATRGFLLQGSNSNFFQYNKFRNLAFESLYAAFDIAKSTRTTSFGQESNVDWITFDDISIRGGSISAVYGWIWEYGSGTGTTYNNIKTSMGDATGAVFNYQSAVVGDIVITGSHFGGVAGASLITINSSSNYRQNIMVAGSQLDAGMNVPFAFPTNSPQLQRISFTGNNVGGGVSMSYPALSDSLIDDQLADQRRAGKTFTTTATTAQTVQLFQVSIDPLLQFGGTSCEVTATGLVGGVAGGAVRASYLLASNSNTASVTQIGTTTSTSAAAAFFTLATATNTAGQVTFSTTFTPSGGNSSLDAQIRCSGGIYSVARL